MQFCSCILSLALQNPGLQFSWFMEELQPSLCTQEFGSKHCVLTPSHQGGAEGEQLWDGDGQREAKGWLSGQGDTSESRGPLGRMGVATAALGQEQSEVCLWVLSPRGGQEENRLCPCWFHFCWAGTRQGRATAKKYSHLCFCKCKL